MANLIIRSISEIDQETFEPLYWSEDDGWVDLYLATRFPEEEALLFLNLPCGGEWVTERPIRLWDGK